MSRKSFRAAKLAVTTALRVAEDANVSEPTTHKLFKGTLSMTGWTRNDFEAAQIEESPAAEGWNRDGTKN